MKVFSLIISMVLSSLLHQAIAQQISIGEEIPKVVLSNLYNSKQDTVDLSTFRGKFVVLDFWNTTCASCIKGLHEWDGLQRQFKDDLIIIAVTNEARENVQRFWSRNKFLSEIAIPTVVSDTLLHSYFPHNGVPHLVWIGREGQLLHTTNGAYTRPEDIQTLIRGTTNHWINTDSVRHADYSMPLFKWQTRTQRNYGYYGILTPFIPNIHGDVHVDSNFLDKYLKITYVNNPVLGLYHATLQCHPELQNNKRKLVKVTDSTALWPTLSTKNRNEWNEQYRFCYELSYPLNSLLGKAQAFEKMRKDLNTFLPYTGEIIVVDTVFYEIIPKNISSDSFVGQSTYKTLSLREWLNRNDRNDELPILVVGDQVPSTALIQVSNIKADSFSRVRQILSDNGYIIVKRNGPLKFFELTENP